ncbi:MAG: hypothetical protein ACRDNP_15110, partial [Gaiellaceae bacterium]
MVETSESGYRALLAWALELGVPAFAVKGSSSFGAGLVRFLERAGVAVWECERPRRRERRRGMSDAIDAALAARPAAVQRRALPSSGWWTGRRAAPAPARASKGHPGAHGRPQPA